jgi:hypothetical protein
LIKYGSKEGLKKAKKEAYKGHHDLYGSSKGVFSNKRTLQYARFGEIFLVGIEGNRQFVEQIRKDINNFLKSNLHLEIKKDNVIQQNKGVIYFLGHVLKLQEYKVKTDKKLKIIRAFKKHKKKVIARFNEVEKYLAKVKTQQIRINVLKQVNAICSVFKLPLKSSKKSLFYIIEKIIAFREVGNTLKNILKIKDYNKFLTFIEATKNIDLVKFDNPALCR